MGSRLVLDGLQWPDHHNFLWFGTPLPIFKNTELIDLQKSMEREIIDYNIGRVSGFSRVNNYTRN